jgi:hypothetical protein
MHDIETLHGTKDRLGRRQYSVRNDHRHSKDANSFQKSFHELASFYPMADMSAGASEIAG